MKEKRDRDREDDTAQVLQQRADGHAHVYTADDASDRTPATATATAAKSAILQLAAAANGVMRTKKRDEVVQAVKAAAATATGDLEMEFWKKIIAILDSIFG